MRRCHRITSSGKKCTRILSNNRRKYCWQHSRKHSSKIKNSSRRSRRSRKQIGGAGERQIKCSKDRSGNLKCQGTKSCSKGDSGKSKYKYKCKSSDNDNINYICDIGDKLGTTDFYCLLTNNDKKIEDPSNTAVFLFYNSEKVSAFELESWNAVVKEAGIKSPEVIKSLDDPLVLRAQEEQKKIVLLYYVLTGTRLDHALRMHNLPKGKERRWESSLALHATSRFSKVIIVRNRMEVRDEPVPLKEDSPPLRGDINIEYVEVFYYPGKGLFKEASKKAIQRIQALFTKK